MKSFNVGLHLNKTWLGWVGIGSIVLLQTVSADTFNHDGTVDIAPETVDCQATLGSRSNTESGKFDISLTHLLPAQTYQVSFTAPPYNIYDDDNCDYYVKVDAAVLLYGAQYYGATIRAELDGDSVKIEGAGTTTPVDTTLTLTTEPTQVIEDINARVKYTVYAVDKGTGAP